MKQRFTTFEDLECWKAGREVMLFVKKIILKLPKSEQFDLIDNMRRASRSVTRNIAEGFGRFHLQENIQFCRISRGSLHELIDDIITCKQDNCIDAKEYEEGRELIRKAIAILNGYINYLKKAKNGEKE